MCGIAGIYSKTQPFSESEIRGMISVLKHRGPDADGIFISENCALGHKRLSILDLSDNANQPMTSHNSRFVMVYNGEVYNYREIAAELKQSFQCEFKTSSDTEVILEAFVNYGVGFVDKLNGMFAIAIFDKQTKELFLFRDRLGIKPLYYASIEGTIYFASELKAIKKGVGNKLKLNYEAIESFLHVGFISAPFSIYKEVSKLESGHYIKINTQGVEKHKYWSSFDVITEGTMTNEKEALVKFSDLLSSSVQYQLKSDVPFGVFLSGGIDSSLITAQAAAISSVSVNTFSIGFKENRFNESIYAEQVAKYLKTNHHEFIVSQNDAIELIDELMNVYDEPFADSSAIPTMLVSKLARKHVTVCLSGEGGDELFLGYGAYQWANRLNNPIVRNFKKPIAFLLENSGTRFQRHASYFKNKNQQLQYSHILSQEQYFFSSREIQQLFTPYALEKIPKQQLLFVGFNEKINRLPRTLNDMEKQAMFDVNFYLQEDLLTKVDRASMKYSLETRVPFLDHRIVEFALNLSPNLKYKNGTTKYLLKEILFQYLPKSYFNRSKQGFAIPLSSWLKTDLCFLITDYLNESIINKLGVVKYSEVEQLKKRYLLGEDYLYNRIWMLIVLHKFLEKN
ncbi:MAG: asparagine synthase (glutamine-hydrolyzing) [Flavobacteriales bacterium]|nr:asparagine synthase (glutamine-hydrolyzing) [Flavobacteriales bacterium]